jgi:hypothetical protein
VHVTANGLQVTVATAIDWQCLVAPAEQVPKFFVPMVKPAGVNPQEPVHPLDRIAWRHFGNQMKVIAHKTPGMELPVGFLAGFDEGIQEEVAVIIIQKDGLAAISALHQMINRAGILHSELPGHPEWRINGTEANVKHRIELGWSK